MGMKGCYDGNECIQWHTCPRGTCKVSEQVEQLRSQENEDAPTQRVHYTGETTEIIPGQLSVEYINDPVTGEPTRAIGNVEPETMDFTVFQFREDLSLSEEEVANLRNRFQEINHRAMNMWIPNLPPQVVSDYEAGQAAMTRTYPKKHRCLFCAIVSLLPGHHRCVHGRLVCEQCELEAGGW